MSFVQWLALAGVASFVIFLVVLAWAYATGRLKNGPNEPHSQRRWVPHSLRMKPLGHGIYKAHDERRVERETRDASSDSG